MQLKFSYILKAIIFLMAFFCGNLAKSQIQSYDLLYESADISISGKTNDEGTGKGLAFGDINGDGYDDIIFSSPQSIDKNNVGHIYIVYGSANINNSINLEVNSADVIINGADSAGFFGENILVDDFSCDGIADILIAEPSANTNERINAGRVYLFLGSTSIPKLLENPIETANVIFEGARSGDHLGTALAGGDVNSDGLKDFVIGADGADSPNSVSCGATFVIMNSAELLNSALVDLNSSFHGHVIYGKDSNDLSGRAVSCTDINADGNEDVIISAYKADTPVPNVISDAGEVYILFMNESDPHIIDLKMTDPDITILGDERRGWFGFSIAAEDINHDNYGDLVISAPQVNSDSCIDAGAVYVFSGFIIQDKRVIDLNFILPTVKIIGPSIYANLGSSLVIDDIDVSGNMDLFVGASQTSTEGRNAAGAVFMIKDFFYSDSVIDLGNMETDVAIWGEMSSGFLGTSLSVGDFDADLKNDILISAPKCIPVGKVYCILGQHFVSIDNKIRYSPNPDDFILLQNYPNPFSSGSSHYIFTNGGTNLSYKVLKRCQLQIIIYNIRGEQVTELLHSEPHSPGTYKILWNGQNQSGVTVSSGIYFASFKTDKTFGWQRLLLIR